MNMKRVPAYLILISVAIFAPPAPTHGEDGETQATPQEALKERQQFNKLRRSTRNIYKVTMRSTLVYRLQTALGYVSTIDLPEKALKVFVGDQELFKVGVYEKQVLIKPVTDERDARTNLFIVTESGRLAFDVSVGPPETADFVLDFRFPHDDEMLVQNAFEKKVEEKAKALEEKYRARAGKLEEEAEKLSEAKLKEKIASAVKTIPLRASQARSDIQVNLLSLSQVGDKAYLRFSVLNYSDAPYRVLKAMVGAVTEDRRFLRKRPEGLIEFPSELSLSDVIAPDTYVYGVLAFDYRVLGRKENPLFRILEDVQNPGGTPAGRTIEIKGFPWFE
jgi:hypothetical protein